MEEKKTIQNVFSIQQVKELVLAPYQFPIIITQNDMKKGFKKMRKNG